MTTARLRVGSISVDGTPISHTDVERIAAEARLNEDLQRRTVLVIAGAARDAQECRILLDMLGIESAAIEAARTPHPKRSAKSAKMTRHAQRKPSTSRRSASA